LNIIENYGIKLHDILSYNYFVLFSLLFILHQFDFYVVQKKNMVKNIQIEFKGKRMLVSILNDEMQFLQNDKDFLTKHLPEYLLFGFFGVNLKEYKEEILKIINENIIELE